ncbi:MAG: nucleotidyl transferase AbiEii/AbiGii toxin family protein [Verrucomicrobiota bacterium]
MSQELKTLQDVVTRLEDGGILYMLTGSMALNCYALPRMTRDIDLVVSLHLQDAARIESLLGEDYYVSSDAARDAVLQQGSFNAIHQDTLIKVDFMVRNLDPYRRHELSRRVRLDLGDFAVWVVSKEDLVLSKLDWAKDSHSARQLADVENLIATGCDTEYLREWSARLNLTDMLTRVLP